MYEHYGTNQQAELTAGLQMPDGEELLQYEDAGVRFVHEGAPPTDYEFYSIEIVNSPGAYPQGLYLLHKTDSNGNKYVVLRGEPWLGEAVTNQTMIFQAVFHRLPGAPTTLPAVKTGHQITLFLDVLPAGSGVSYPSPSGGGSGGGGGSDDGGCRASGSTGLLPMILLALLGGVWFVRKKRAIE